MSEVRASVGCHSRPGPRAGSPSRRRSTGVDHRRIGARHDKHLLVAGRSKDSEGDCGARQWCVRLSAHFIDREAFALSLANLRAGVIEVEAR